MMKINVKLFSIVGTILVISIIGGWFFWSRQRPREPLGKVAIVIDDWGYNKRFLPLLYQIDCPITLAILPHLSYSRQISEKARERGYEVILHLPLEAHGDKVRCEAGTIYCNMEEEKVIEMLNEALVDMPGIVGISNHQGSKATEDARLMSIVFSEAKRRSLYFLDSLTTNHSVCSKVAGERGVKFAKRDIFLDVGEQAPESDREGRVAYIKNQLHKLADEAIHNGTAVGIGHDNQLTLQIIKEEIPELEKRGIKFVYLSELVKSSTQPRKTSSRDRQVERCARSSMLDARSSILATQYQKFYCEYLVSLLRQSFEGQASIKYQKVFSLLPTLFLV